MRDPTVSSQISAMGKTAGVKTALYSTSTPPYCFISLFVVLFYYVRVSHSGIVKQNNE